MQIIVYVLCLFFLAIPLGHYIGRILDGERMGLLRPLYKLENFIYRLSGIKTTVEMDAKQYAWALVVFNGIGLLVVLCLQLTQAHLPLNPQNLPNVPFFLALNTAVSFVTNTNWQAYAGESTMSYLTQMVALGGQNFFSAATGLGVAAVIARALARKSTKLLGNFWVDVVRTIVFILLPLALILSLILVQQGVLQNFSSYVGAKTLEGAEQILPMGPVASQVAIKQLGSNGGGFFGVNSAHPFENPTPFTNFLEMLAILMIPAAIPIAFGTMVKNVRHGYSIFLAMLTLFLIGLSVSLFSESMFHTLTSASRLLEGKEVRFGITGSALWSTATTAASNGSVNAMLDSYSPLAGGVAMFNLMIGEVIFGGVGAGMYGMVLFVILTVFISGLMVGRSPEYLGKKIEAREIKLAVVGVLAPSALILVFAAIACLIPAGLKGLGNHGPHGLSEILYAFASTAANNGSAFSGLNANTNFYNIMTAIAMLLGRFLVIFPVIAIAGSLAAKKQTPPSTGTFPTEGGLFVALLCSVVFIVGGLTFLPALSLGPIIEHFLMLAGRTF